jgi:hypothetical protein
MALLDKPVSIRLCAVARNDLATTRAIRG